MRTILPVTIGEAIRINRRARGLTQVELYKAVLADGGPTDTDIDQSVISRWERNMRRIGLEDVVTLERVLGLPRGRLLIEGGYVEGIHTVDQAIAADESLSPDLKRSLRTAYEGIKSLAGRELSR